MIGNGNIIDLAIIALRVMTFIPLVGFVLVQWRYFRAYNGLVWKVRRITLVFVGSVALMILSHAILRVQILFGVDPVGDNADWLVLATSVLVFWGTCFAHREIKQVVKSEKIRQIYE